MTTTKILYTFSAVASAFYFVLSVFFLSSIDSLPVPSNSALAVFVALGLGYGLFQPVHLALVILAHQTELEMK